MTQNAEAKLTWLNEVLGVGKDDESEEELQQKGFFESIGDMVSGAVDTVVKLVSGPEPTEEQKKLNAKVDTLEKLGLDTKRLKGDGADQAKKLAAAAKITDEAERKAAIDLVNKRIEELEQHAAALEAAVKSVMGSAKGAPNATQKAAIYKKALEDHYGLAIQIPSGMSNTHMDRVYDMMGTVPKGQAKHDKLDKLEYIDTNDYKGSGAYGGTTIKMGDFGDASGMENYTVDGKTLPANSFDVTTLHELGHALDSKEGIMAAHMSKTGCGGWKTESKDSTIDALVAFFKKKVKVSDKMTEAMVRSAIDSALGGAIPAAPDGAEEDDWDKVRDFLGDYPMKIRSGYSPWFKDPVDVDGRAYIQSYSTRWNSYSVAARAPTLVNKYQWRAPGEWFAEVYAISWLKKTKPPAAVDKAVAEYMWKP